MSEEVTSQYSTQEGKGKHEIQGQQKGEGNFQASGEGKSQDKSCVADQRVTNPQNRKIKGSGEHSPGQKEKRNDNMV